MRRAWRVALVFLVGVWSRDAAAAGWTLQDAVRHALATHPAVAEAQAERSARAADVSAARAARRPRVDLSLQLLRATGNVVPGSLWPMPGLPAISGPPLPSRFDGGAWGTSISAASSVEVVSMVEATRAIEAARSEQIGATAELELARLDMAYAIAWAYLDALQSERVAAIQAEDVARAQVIAEKARALVDAGLRPGHDVSRAEADQATALAQLEQARALVLAAHARLAGQLGLADDVALDATGLLEPADTTSAAVHPALRAADARQQAAQGRRRVVALGFAPRFSIFAALSARGSGLTDPPRLSLGAGYGLIPDTPNWGIGVLLTWNVFEVPATRARIQQADAEIERMQAQRASVERALTVQEREAEAQLRGAVAVASKTPAAVMAASTALRQIQGRYDGGLVTAVEVADTRRRLVEAEVADTTAKISVQRARFARARVRGELGPFLGDAPAGGR